MNLLFVLLAGSAQAQVLTVSAYYQQPNADGTFTTPPQGPAPSGCAGPTQLVAGVDVTMNAIGVLMGIGGGPIATVRLNAENTDSNQTAIPNQTCRTGDKAVLCTTSYSSTLGYYASACTTYLTGTCTALGSLAFPIIGDGTDSPTYIKIECTKSKAQEPAAEKAKNYTNILNGIAGMVGALLFGLAVCIMCWWIEKKSGQKHDGKDVASDLDGKALDGKALTGDYM